MPPLPTLWVVGSDWEERLRLREKESKACHESTLLKFLRFANASACNNQRLA